MPTAEPTNDALKAMAALAGLDMSDERLDEVLSQAQRAHEARVQLRELDLGEAESASVFAPRGM